MAQPELENDPTRAGRIVRAGARVVEWVEREDAPLAAAGHLRQGAWVVLVAAKDVDRARLHDRHRSVHTVVGRPVPRALLGTADCVFAPAHVDAVPALLAPGGCWVVDGRVRMADPRPAQRLPSPLRELGRTACVDRSRIRQAFARPSWRCSRLLVEASPTMVEPQQRALMAALAGSALDPAQLPWPTHGPVGAGVEPGCDVLAIMPHPDDESIYAGSTLRAWAQAGQRVHLVVATDGAGGRGGSGRRLARTRARELLQACAVLGIRSVAGLGWADGGKYIDADRLVPATAADALRQWGGEREALRDVVDVIRLHRPRVLLSLGPRVDPNYSLHGHHLGLGVLAAAAFHLAAAPWFATGRPAWCVHQHQVMAPPEHGTLWVREHGPSKAQAVRAHACQRYSTERTLRRLDAEASGVEWRRVAQSRPVISAAVTDVADRAPATLHRVAARAGALAATSGYPRGELAAAVGRQLHALPPDSARAAALADLSCEDSVVVCAGQQVGALGGPAFTLSKAVAAASLAAWLRRQGLRAVAVFWMASYDHDLAEVQRIRSLEGRTWSFGLPDQGRPVGNLLLGPAAPLATDAWAGHLGVDPGHPFRGWVRGIHRPDATFTEAFVQTLGALTRGTGLLPLDPSDPAVAALGRGLLAAALRDPSGLDAARARARARLRAEGQAEVVPMRLGRPPVFRAPAGAARARVYEAESALQELHDHPERFSPSALLRPVLQDAIMPVAATVAGPTEARYLHQTPELYRWAAVEPSVVVVRPEIRWVWEADVEALGGPAPARRILHSSAPFAAAARGWLPPAIRGWLVVLERAIASLSELIEPARSDELDVGGAAWALMLELEQTAERSGVARLRTGLYWRAMAARRRAWICDGTGHGRARALGRVVRHLRRVRTGLLRDARRGNPGVAALGRLLEAPAPAERRMTCAELWWRTRGSATSVLRGALEAGFPRAMTVCLGGTR